MSIGPRTLSVSALLLLAACAAQYAVNTTADFPDANPGDHVCAGGRGNLCSLRAAIEETNAQPAGDAVRIVVPAGTYDLNEELVLTHGDVAIIGADRDNTIIRQTGLSPNGYRVLMITASGNIWIQRVTLRDGQASNLGGAITFSGNGSHSLTLSECRIRDNRAYGGALYAEGAKGYLNILNCVIQDNASTDASCSAGGGGIMVNGARLLLFRTEIRDNCGAGVAIYGGVDHLILQSTIAGNNSGTLAGGLYMTVGAQGRIEDSTIAKNNGPEAGGIYISDANLVIKSATIVGNASSNGPPNRPGGVLSKDGANVSLKNTVIASNTGPPSNCSGELLSFGGNFIGTLDNSCTFVGAATDVVNGGSPGLGSLGPNGGPTRSMLPNYNSPLRNAGVPGCDPTDQRGQPAPVAACDIGAVERQPTVVPAIPLGQLSNSPTGARRLFAAFELPH